MDFFKNFIKKRISIGRSKPKKSLDEYFHILIGSSLVIVSHSYFVMSAGFFHSSNHRYMHDLDKDRFEI